LTGVFVVFGVAAVGPSLQAAATAPPRQRKARVKRDNICEYLGRMPDDLSPSYWQAKRPCGSGSVQFCVVPS